MPGWSHGVSSPEAGVSTGLAFAASFAATPFWKISSSADGFLAACVLSPAPASEANCEAPLNASSAVGRCLARSSSSAVFMRLTPARLSFRSPLAFSSSSVASAWRLACSGSAALARSICSRISLALRSSSSSSATFRLAFIACRIFSSLSSGLYVMNQPFGVSSTSQMPSRPRYLMNSVSVVHLVEFMWMCVLCAMYSLYTMLALTLLFLCDVAIRLRKSLLNCSL
mmetsp:Transcript_2158/g.8690  ORF Transcript_2158/g.8690 Transcript_2158/m.8690 type:complete len:227 (+) Transcript_2158:4628-5308(+)